MIYIVATKDNKPVEMREINGTIERKCRRCEEWLTLDKYYSKNKNSPNWIDNMCKKCRIANSKEIQEANIERKRESARKYASKDYVKKRNKIVRQKQKENGYYDNWRELNKDKLYEYSRKHFQHKHHDISQEELQVLYEFANNSCMYCGLTEEESLREFKQKLHRDHAKNKGSNKIENCILACKRCNALKSHLDWDVWYVPDNPRYNYKRFKRIKLWLNQFDSIGLESD